MPFSKKLARYARRALLIFAVVATLAVGIVVVENWRGERAWRAYAARQAALGDPVDVFPAPSSLPPERNFMKTPVLDRVLFAELEERKKFVRAVVQPSIRPEWRNGQIFDLKAYVSRQREERRRLGLPDLPTEESVAKEVISAQAAIEPFLTALSLAVRDRTESQIVRPRAITKESFLEVPVANFDVFRTLVDGLSIRACALLSEGDGAGSLESSLAALRLVRGFTDQPDICVVEAVMGNVQAKKSLQPVWEGLLRGAWRDDQLVRLQNEMAAIQPMAAVSRGIRLERVGIMGLLAQLSAGELIRLGSHPEQRSIMSYLWLPRGWLLQNAVIAGSAMQDSLDVLDQQGTPGFVPALTNHFRTRASFETQRTTVVDFYAKMAVISPKVISSASSVEVEVTLARTACALERHRLAHGDYPEALNALVPAYLEAVPRDVIDGQPLRYRKNGDESFVLYSIGLDGKDDGGAPSDWSTDEGRRQGDWCWPQPAK